MPCTDPKKAWVHGVTENGKDKYVFRDPGTGSEEHLLPCQKCVSCQFDKAKEWATRGFHQSQCHSENSFITLTYNDKNLPENSTLVKQDLTLFIKRLRSRINEGRKKYLDKERTIINPDWIDIKYLASGEYGSEDNTHRPHYHICLFGYDPRDKEYLFTNEWNDPVYTSQFISSVWENKGFISVCQLTYRTCAYVARYTVKKIVKKEDRKWYTYDKEGNPVYWYDEETGETNYEPIAYKKALLMQHKIPEFITMSNGIGKEWHDKHEQDTHKDYVIVNYAKHKVPRYYDKLLEEKKPLLLEEIKSKRVEAAKETKRTDQENRSKDVIAKQNLKKLKRKL
jgi:hypothetical protein